EAGEKLRHEQSQCSCPDTRFTRNCDHPVTLGNGLRGDREPGPGDLLPGRLNPGEQGGRRDVGKNAVEGGGEGARGDAFRPPPARVVPETAPFSTRTRPPPASAVPGTWSGSVVVITDWAPERSRAASRSRR